MSGEKKKSLLFIEAEKSQFQLNTKVFEEQFASVERVQSEQKALKLVYKNSYDLVITDMSEDVIQSTTFMKQLKEMKPEQEIFGFVVSEDEENIGGLIDAGIHSFVFLPEQFEQALEAVAQLDPQETKTPAT